MEPEPYFSLQYVHEIIENVIMRECPELMQDMKAKRSVFLQHKSSSFYSWTQEGIVKYEPQYGFTKIEAKVYANIWIASRTFRAGGVTLSYEFLRQLADAYRAHFVKAAKNYERVPSTLTITYHSVAITVAIHRIQLLTRKQLLHSTGIISLEQKVLADGKI